MDRIITAPKIRVRSTSADCRFSNDTGYLPYHSALLVQEDPDRDKQITVQDLGPKVFSLYTQDSGGWYPVEIRGTYFLSNLLQELERGKGGTSQITITASRIYESPVTRIQRLIRCEFWDALVRTIDWPGIVKVTADSKNRNLDIANRIYIPFRDDFAFDYFTECSKKNPQIQLDIVRLPLNITPEYVKSINEHPGILALQLEEIEVEGKPHIKGSPFVVPGGRFNEMYGWDSYFEGLGLIHDGRPELAKSMIDNFCYELEHYGKILNANRSYYLTRSQPPFLTDMIIQTYETICEPGIHIVTEDKVVWLGRAVRAAFKELFGVWLTPPRINVNGLCSYHDEGIGMPPETEATHFVHIVEPYAKELGISFEDYVCRYNSGEILEPKLDEYFKHDRAVRESGHDTTYRLEGICADLATIDLTCLLFKFETDLDMFMNKYFNGYMQLRIRRGIDDCALKSFQEWAVLVNATGVESMHDWNNVWAQNIRIYDKTADLSISDMDFMENLVKKVSYIVEDQENFVVSIPSSLLKDLASHTRELADKFLWNEKQGMYFDYNCKKSQQSTYESVTCMWALWAGMASNTQAAVLVPKAIQLFGETGGLTSGTKSSRGELCAERPSRQWDYPFGWSPHQIIAWQGLENYGFSKERESLTYRWLYTIVSSFQNYNGVVPEKFDVVKMTHKVDVEYGNVGSDFQYLAKEGFGWMNASVSLGLKGLSRKHTRLLENLVHPSYLFSVANECPP